MKVLSIANSLNDLDVEKKQLVANVGLIKKLNFDHPPIDIGVTFVVYGIATSNNNLFYDIIPLGCNYSISVLSCFFDIVDDRVSSIWRFARKKGNDFVLWPKSWIDNPFYHDLLTDGDAEVLSDFKNLVELLNKEFTEK